MARRIRVNLMVAAGFTVTVTVGVYRLAVIWKLKLSRPLNGADGMVVDLYRRSAVGWKVVAGHV
jgi:hypothetical protein